MLPVGPVLFIDTAGIDDEGALGELRIQRTRQIFERTEVGIIVSEAGAWGEFEEQLLAELRKRGTGVIVVFNKADLAEPGAAIMERLNAAGIPFVRTVASRGQGVLDLREAMIRTAPEEFINAPSILGDLVPPGELVVLVVPIDMEAPKGRLILPQVQAIRDTLDADAYCMVVKERELRDALDRLKRPPALVVTDSQAFLKVAADHARGDPADVVLDPVRAVQGRSGRNDPRSPGHRHAAAGRFASSWRSPARITRSATTSGGSKSPAG